MKRQTLLYALTTLAGLFPVFHANAVETKIGGIYSNLRYNQDGGDLLGTELLVVGTENGWVVFYQHWEGGADKPIVVPATVDHDHISFAIPDSDGGGGGYEGRISISGFEGTVRHRDSTGATKADPISLKRKPSYWE